MKKLASKVAQKQHIFSVMPTGPNPGQISIPDPSKSPTAGLLYNDFGEVKTMRKIAPSFCVLLRIYEL